MNAADAIVILVNAVLIAMNMVVIITILKNRRNKRKQERSEKSNVRRDESFYQRNSEQHEEDG